MRREDLWGRKRGEFARACMADSILTAKEHRWAKKLSMAKALEARDPDRPASLVVLTLRMSAPLRTSGRFSSTALSMHAAFTRELRERGIPILQEEFRVSGDGPESYIAVTLDPIALKRLAVGWETDHPWGELADLDIMDSKGKPVSRVDLGLPPRVCLICGEEAAVCVTGRRHELGAIEARVEEILRKPEQAGSAEDRRIGRLALTAALFEASAVPKPVLVDPLSCGAHRDMDYSTFLSSAAAIGPWFAEFVKLGRLHKGEPADLLPALRETGKAAERDMFEATGGVNTHKGLIFSMGLLCAAAGRLAAAGSGYDPASCAAGASAIVRGISARDFGGLEATQSARTTGNSSAPATPTVDQAAPVANEAARFARTTGERLYLAYGVRGIRGEAEDGFPAVLGHALPKLRADLSAGLAWNDAMIDALLVLCTIVEDTNVLGRAGLDGLAFLRAEAARALGLGGMATLEGGAAARAMDASLTKRNISPGGCADLLALTVFLEMLAPSLPREGEPMVQR